MQVHLLRAISVVLAVCVLQTGCAAPSGAVQRQTAFARTDSSGVLRAGYITYPPSFITTPDGSQKSGIMYDVMQRVAQGLNFKVEYVEETSWATMIETVNSGRVDVVVTGLWPSSARARRADFSRPVYYSPVQAYVSAGKTSFDGDLAKINTASTRIATIDGELSAIVAKSDFPNAQTVSLPSSTDVSQLLLQLTTDKADVTFVEPAIAAGFLAKNPGTIRKVNGVSPVRVFPNVFMVAKGETDLLNALNVAVDELVATNVVGATLARYDPSHDLFLTPAAPFAQPR